MRRDIAFRSIVRKRTGKLTDLVCLCVAGTIISILQQSLESSMFWEYSVVNV